VARVSPKAAGAVLAAAAALVAVWEGYKPTTYLDPIGIPTTCYGHTGADVRPGQTRTRAECVALLQEDVATAYAGVMRCLTRPVPDGMAAAFTSFAYNAGAATFCRSSMARKANAGDFAGACKALDLYVYAGGQRLTGLVRRRAAERAMCEGVA
jgi:lysozyme